LPPGVVNVVNGMASGRGGAGGASGSGQDRVYRQRVGGQDYCEECGRYAEAGDAGAGGKSPNVFFADADWEAAVDGALFGVFINQGEVCSAGSRILVEKKIYSKFVEAMTEKPSASSWARRSTRHQDGAAGQQGAYDRVTSYMEIGKKEAKTAIGGGRAKAFGKDSTWSRRYSMTSTIRRVSPAKKFLGRWRR